MTGRRVAVTGIGVLCAAGRNTGEFWESLSSGRPAIGPLENLPPLRFPNGAQIRGFDPAAHFNERSADLYDPFVQYGVIAAREAIASAGIEWTAELKESSGVITGSCLGGKPTEDIAFRALYGKNNTRIPPMTIPKIMANAAASFVGMEFGLTGPSLTFATACSSSNHALGHAYWMVRSGSLELALAGGSEAPFSEGHLRAWEALRVVAPDTCRPFSRDRKGMILGEGAAFLVLEPLEAAHARGARVLAEIVGFGMSADAGHITQPSPDGAARALKAALRDAGLAPQAIGYINAHGTGTLANDVSETAGLRAAFGAHADRLAISSTKSMHGHVLGAAGAIECAATVLALSHGVLPPTANYLGADPQCDLDVIPNDPRRMQVEYALSNSFAFGGLNAVLALRAG